MMKEVLGISGEYNVQLIRDDVCFYETGFRKNLILNNFFTCTTSANSGTYWQLSVGTGTTAPAITQTTLVNAIASTNDISSSVDEMLTTNGTTWVVVATTNFRFPLGGVVGSISEIGLTLGHASPPTVHTRALITDVNNQPTTITVTALDQLLITYKIKITGLEADRTGTVNLAGINHTWRTRRALPSAVIESAHNNILSVRSAILAGYHLYNYVYDSSHALGNIGEPIQPSGEIAVVTCAIDNSTAGRIRHNITASIEEGNVTGGIAYISSNAYTMTPFKISFTPAIPKNNQKALSLLLEYTLTRA